MERVIKTKKEYEAALTEIEKLIEIDPNPESSEGDKLELLSLLVENYENKEFKFPLPDPIEAIKFVMEQRGLSPRDLIPLLGSRSKVSEILAKKKPLTLTMLRALHANLGIPASVLLQDQGLSDIETTHIDWNRFPLKTMIARGWIKASVKELQIRAKDILFAYLSNLGDLDEYFALYKHTNLQRSARSMDIYALIAWTARIVQKANDITSINEYKLNTVNLNFMKELAKLSTLEDGPVQAQKRLYYYGIQLIIEPHLPKTYLDGAAIMNDRKRPIIGLTIRHDRIDNFWFCLMHELAHIALHIKSDTPQFFDDLDTENLENNLEREADELASEALIPNELWENSPASKLRSPEAAEHLANQLGIHPAIVAGRMRYKFRAFRLLNNIVGHGKIRAQFKGIKWEGK